MRALACLPAFAVAVVVAVVAPWAARAETPPAVFALIVGSNQSVDGELQPLRYADDDAARNADLFRQLGARVHLLIRADDNTARLHPETARGADRSRLPRLYPLRQAVAQIGREVRAARDEGRPTILYFLYAGHGSADDGEGYITLEDTRLYGRDLVSEIVDPVGADQAHLIVDACQSFFLATGRGPGGKRREVRGFSRAPALSNRPDVGLLLSTSTARESHEWEGFQAGVFSHEVRSGLYGAADLDGDGRVSYQEIGAFVERANAGIPNERFRPNVYARPPRAGGGLLDLRSALARQLVVPAGQQAHYVLEDARGVRIIEFHKAPASRPLRLVKPDRAGPMYLERLDQPPQEYLIEAAPARVDLAFLTPRRPHAITRGAAHDAFGLIFALPLDSAASETFVVAGHEPPPVEPSRWRALASRAALVTAGVALATSVGIAVWGQTLRSGAPANESQTQTMARNQGIESRNRAAMVSLGVAGVALVGSAILQFWYEDTPDVEVALSSGGASIGYRARF